IENNPSPLSLIGLCLGELRDFPLSLIREHLREWRQKAINPYLEVMMTSSTTSQRAIWMCVISSMVMFALYSFIVIRPFFVQGLNLESMTAIHNGMLSQYNNSSYGY